MELQVSAISLVIEKGQLSQWITVFLAGRKNKRVGTIFQTVPAASSLEILR